MRTGGKAQRLSWIVVTLVIGAKPSLARSLQGQPTKTLADLINADADLNKFRYMFGNRHHLFAQFDDPTANITLFAPTNEAFDSLGVFLYWYLEPQWILHSRDILETHMVDGSFLMNNVPVGQRSNITMRNGELVRVTADINSSVIELSATGRSPYGDSGSATVLRKDIEATNGVLHTISEPLLPEWCSHMLLTWVFRETDFHKDFSIAIEFVLKSGLWVGDKGNEFTALIPTDAAFKALGNETLDFFRDPDNAEDLNDMLLNHLVDKAYPLENAKDGDTLRTIAGNIISVSAKNDTITLNGIQLGQKRDQIANNGILHAIEGVLWSPSSTASPSPGAASVTTAPSKGPLSSPTERPSFKPIDPNTADSSSSAGLSTIAVVGIGTAGGLVFMFLGASLFYYLFNKANPSIQAIAYLAGNSGDDNQDNHDVEPVIVEILPPSSQQRAPLDTRSPSQEQPLPEFKDQVRSPSSQRRAPLDTGTRTVIPEKRLPEFKDQVGQLSVPASKRSRELNSFLAVDIEPETVSPCHENSSHCDSEARRSHPEPIEDSVEPGQHDSCGRFHC